MLLGEDRAIVDSTIATDQSVPPSVPSPTSSQSRFGPPFAVVAAARTVLAPAASELVAHESHDPVPPNARPEDTTLPFTMMSIGRLVPVPLAYRRPSVTGP